MQKFNEKIVEAIFERMNEVKRKSGFKELESQDENGEDVRGAKIISNFPYPIGAEFRKLLHPNHIQHDSNRLNVISLILDRTIRFLAYIIIVQVWDYKKDNSAMELKNFPEQLSDIKRLTFGRLVGIVREGLNILQQNNVSSFVEELEMFYKSKERSRLLSPLDKLVELRNYISHNKADIDKQKFIDYEDNLQSFLCEIAFLIKYKLVKVKQITVERYKHKPPTFSHKLKKLNVNITTDEIDFSEPQFSESHSVLLLKDFTRPSVFLNLSPLLIDVEPNDQEKNDTASGLYLFGESDEDTYTYYPCESAKKTFNINDFKGNVKEVLIQQFESLKETLLA